MRQLIILEGPDECGKTTLAREIARQLKMTLWHSTASPALFQGLADYHRNILENIHDNWQVHDDVGYVLDRFWPSEYCYGVKFKRPDSGYPYEEIAGMCEVMGAQYVFCFSPNGWDRYKQGHVDPAHSLTSKEYHQVYENYKDLYMSMADKALLYVPEEDGTESSLPQFIRMVSLYATKQANR